MSRRKTNLRKRKELKRLQLEKEYLKFQNDKLIKTIYNFFAKINTIKKERQKP